MKKEERLRKLKLLNEFCQQSGLKEDELEELFLDAQQIARGASFDIYYDILSDKIPMTLEEAPEMLTRAIGMIVRPLSESIR